MTVQVDGSRTIAGLQLLKAGIAQAAVLALRSAVKAAEDSEKSTTTWKSRSGATRGSIKGVVVGYAGMVVAGGASRFLENGTVAHDIVAKRGGMLRFQVSGVVMFRKMVHHPGTKPTHFVATARAVGAQALAYGAEYYTQYAIQHVR